jgi:hypothetical protein
MPTARPRHQVTETDEVEQALDLAERQWPGESRGQLLVRLIGAGAEAVAESLGAAVEARRQRLDALAGKYTGLYPAGYLAELREDWLE